MLKQLANGNYWFYKLEDGGAGIVKAETEEVAKEKIKDAYEKHSYSDFSEEIEVFSIDQVPFDDAPDVIEICEY